MERLEKEVQKTLDATIAEIDKRTQAKEKELMEI